MPLLLAVLTTAVWGWPVAGTPVVDRGFSPPATAYGPGHRGVDLRGARGEPVLAAGAGRVTYAGLLAGRGVVVVLHPGGLRTTYEPLSPSVHVGQAVVLGQRIGTLDPGHASCRVRTDCLHWGLLRGPVYLDPLSLLRPTSVRLLPLGPATAAALAPPRGDRPAVRGAGVPVVAAAPSTTRHHPSEPLVAVAVVAGGLAVAAGTGLGSSRAPGAPAGTVDTGPLSGGKSGAPAAGAGSRPARGGGRRWRRR